MDLGLKGKVALVTGASRVSAARLRCAGARRRAREHLRPHPGGRLNRRPRNCARLVTRFSPCRADVTDLAQLTAWVERTAEHWGGIDILVNNAGGATVGTLAETGGLGLAGIVCDEFFWAGSAFAAGRAQMESRGGGAIINISSIYGREAGGPIAYNAAKAALISLTKMMAREFASKNIRVNSVAPGSIMYPGGVWEQIFKENPEFERDFISHDFPAGRLGRPEEVAFAVVMLASPKASWITGATLPVDGAQGRSLI